MCTGIIYHRLQPIVARSYMQAVVQVIGLSLKQANVFFTYNYQFLWMFVKRHLVTDELYKYLLYWFWHCVFWVMLLNFQNAMVVII